MTVLVIGLGNPGKEYAQTRHNTGFIVVDALAKKLKVEWDFQSKLFSEVAETGNKKNLVVLAKPQTMMNASGKAAVALAKKYKAKPKDIVVIHDDIDIPLGSYKLSFGKHSAGHKGVESVIRVLKTKDFWRLRIGIHPPKAKKKVDAMKLILGKFKPAEEKILRNVITEALKENPDALIPTLNSTG